MAKISDLFFYENNTTCELNENYKVFIEQLEYDDTLLLELFTHDGEFICNCLDYVSHTITLETDIADFKAYVYKVIKLYEKEHGIKTKFRFLLNDQQKETLKSLAESGTNPIYVLDYFESIRKKKYKKLLEQAYKRHRIKMRDYIHVNQDTVDLIINELKNEIIERSL